MELNTRSTKEEILSLLKIHKQLTVTELAKALGVTEMAVRRHITKLEKDNYIISNLVRQHVGRPTYVYELSAKGEDFFPKQYKDFALEMLDDLLELGEQQLVEQLLQTRTRRMQEVLRQRMADKGNTFSKLSEVVSVQQQNGYMAKLNRTEEGTFLLKKQNCPLLLVAEKLPVLCEHEVQMYQELLPEADVKLVSCVSGGACSCVYEIGEKAL